MKNYEKPIVLANYELSEGVFAASGTAGGTSSSGAPQCNSAYMNGVWHAPDYSNTTSNIERYGCDGCPAFRWNGCGLQLDYVDSGNAESYDVDDGNRKPKWESNELDPNGFTYDYNA